MRCVNGFVWFVALVGELVTLPVAVISFLYIPYANWNPERMLKIFDSPMGAATFYWMLVAWFIAAGTCHYVRRSLEK